MSQFKKLFDKSEIEYITPFLKLWMSFNSWYKSDLTSISTDREAINKYREQGLLKTEFLRLFDLSSEVGINFQNALFELVLNLKSYDLKDKNGASVSYKIEVNGNVFDLILEYADRRGGKEPVYICQKRERFQILEENRDLFFSQTLEVIYIVRNALFHGNYDIENQYFLKLVESSYKVLYPVIDRIQQHNEDKKFFCGNKKGTSAQGMFTEGKVVVLKDSKVCKRAVASYDKTEERQEILRTKANEETGYFILNEDIEFSSPSAASSFCLGSSSNGWDDWKDKNGRTMNEILHDNQT